MRARRRQSREQRQLAPARFPLRVDRSLPYLVPQSELQPHSDLDTPVSTRLAPSTKPPAASPAEDDSPSATSFLHRNGGHAQGARGRAWTHLPAGMLQTRLQRAERTLCSPLPVDHEGPTVVDLPRPGQPSALPHLVSHSRADPSSPYLSNRMSAPAPTGERGGFGRGRGGDRRGPRRGPRRGARKDEEKEWCVPPLLCPVPPFRTNPHLERARTGFPSPSLGVS